MTYIVNHGEECEAFFQDFIVPDRKVLYIGTLGFIDLSLHYPLLLAKFPNVVFIFLVEKRPEVSPILNLIAERNRQALLVGLGQHIPRFECVEIIAEDTANVAGRRAAGVCAAALGDSYSDVFIDVSSMSRGVCFPIVKQVFEASKRHNGCDAHILVAGCNKSGFSATSMSSDTPQYVHGFQSDMDTDKTCDAIKLWVPQLSEGAVESLNRIHRLLGPDESCPILPFPSSDPRRGDMLMREFQFLILNEWDINLRDLIYAHESDPTDVCETIIRIHTSRDDAFKNSTSRLGRTILSPTGSRIGSVGMLLAALRLDLPIMYEESIGYASDMSSVPVLSMNVPDHRWHIWLRP
ncbi:hypothetical protein HMI48_00905 [Acidithiobacillus ferrooxidans]|uniref:hypothetical protein n=1 Tax=Acidithiobacillus ferrooxidans TaxID=920 RepID=UPI001C06F823|nr:hypothetical protein [Acidithiobacillus ferrooxidans]MBU2772521.1 hypothetical protein [Acidithiobacillus ferrooxidans]